MRTKTNGSTSCAEVKKRFVAVCVFQTHQHLNQSLHISFRSTKLAVVVLGELLLGGLQVVIMSLLKIGISIDNLLDSEWLAQRLRE